MPSGRDLLAEAYLGFDSVTTDLVLDFWELAELERTSLITLWFCRIIRLSESKFTVLVKYSGVTSSEASLKLELRECFEFGLNFASFRCDGDEGLFSVFKLTKDW